MNDCFDDCDCPSCNPHAHCAVKEKTVVPGPTATAVCTNCGEGVETWGNGRWRHSKTDTFACRSRTGAEPCCDGVGGRP